MFSSCKTKGLIIKRQKWGEADRILTVFTQDLGKIQVLAKSARKGKSKLSGSLELFNLVSLELVRGYHFDLATGAQCLNSFKILKQDLKKLAWAHFFAEFLNYFTEEKAADRRLYALFRGLFLSLDSGVREEYRGQIASIQWRILEYLGVAPRLSSCLACGSPLFSQEFAFLGEGGMYCPGCAKARKDNWKIDSQTLKILNQIQAAGVKAQDGAIAQNIVETHCNASLHGANFALAYFLSASLAPRIKSLRFLDVGYNPPTPLVRGELYQHDQSCLYPSISTHKKTAF